MLIIVVITKINTRMIKIIDPVPLDNKCTIEKPAQVIMIWMLNWSPDQIIYTVASKNGSRGPKWKTTNFNILISQEWKGHKCLVIVKNVWVLYIILISEKKWVWHFRKWVFSLVPRTLHQIPRRFFLVFFFFGFEETSFLEKRTLWAQVRK